jgi:glycogen debranching enzyme
MNEIIQVEDRHYILATSPRADERSRVLKQGETFAIFDRFGDIRPVGLGEEGLFHEGTRFLNRLTLRLNRRQPLLLSSTARDDNALLTVDLTNADFSDGDHLLLPRDTLHLMRNSFLWEGQLRTRLHLRNFSLEPVDLLLEFMFEADFVDIFEIRGTRRAKRGQMLPPRQGANWVELSYRGLDNVLRVTRLEFSPDPLELSESCARLPAAIPAHGDRDYFITVSCSPRDDVAPSVVLPRLSREEDTGGPPVPRAGNGSPKERHAAPTPLAAFGDALSAYTTELDTRREGEARLTTSSGRFNAWLARSAADMRMMMTQTEQGLYPFAGVPWFSTPFGRDGIISAMEWLWVNPTPVRSVLHFLAVNQATREDPERDAEPGKIFHEMRRGEMAALGEVPFGRYYGTVDATPLFVMLAGAYHERTGDHALIESIWPNIEAALNWIDKYGDPDGDGFVEYARRSQSGLTTQGWKDSYDSVFHGDGTLAESPIALCEVQGYAYAAWRAAAELSIVVGRPQLQAQFERRAAELRERFEQTFWLEDLSTYALALDGRKQPCQVRTSNAGHCLFSGIATPDHAAKVAQTLLADTSFSGWGIRTVATGEVRYNPMSYHNGSIWPHDNAMIAYGMGRYGLNAEAARVLDAMFDVSQAVELHRMPELFCGFPRRRGEGPTLYPVACSPQTWAAGSAFLLLQACLGLTISAAEHTIRLRNPVLPRSLDHLTLSDLRVGDAVVDMLLQRYGSDVGITILRRDGHVEVVVIK